MKFKKIAVFCLVSAALLLAVPSGLSAAAQNGEGVAATEVLETNEGSISAKDEVIYAILENSGSPESVYAVNQFEVSRAGTIVDWGAYDSVQNLTNTQPVTLEGDKVTFAADTGKFYYQGNMDSADLPWRFDLSYYLDGKAIQPQDLAGKSGEIEIKISTRQNEKVDPTFYENYMIQITVSLDADKCSNIDAPNATIADAGENKAVVYTVFPKKDADFSLRATVEDFTMQGIQISAVPYSMDVEFPDTEEQFADLEELPDAVAKLNDGVGELADGAQELENGASELTGGSASIQNALNTLSGNSTTLVDSSAQINTALAGISDSLNDGSLDNIDLTALSQLPDALTQLSSGLGNVSGGMTDLKNAFVPAYSALDTAIQGIPDGTLTQDEINALAPTDPNLAEAFGKLTASYTAAQTVKGTYAQVKGAFDAVGTTMDTLSGSLGTVKESVDSMATEIGTALSNMDGLDGLGELASGLAELSANYGTFHAGLTQYMNGVKTLAGNYSSFHSGIASFENGVDSFGSGIDELHAGTNEFEEETADLPDQMQKEIDNMKEEFLPSEFDPVSFTSAKNTDTDYVQFVIKTSGIEKPEESSETDGAETQQEETFWDRLAALFGK